ncbi:MAG TPA: nucleotide exchange factor GrpE [Acidimicrobiia bacterium]|nr:nucleotide exchange factor GrpE [Acidimicrobiia bacterium]
MSEEQAVPGSDAEASEPDAAEANVEPELSEMELLQRERDELVDAARRVQAEYENYRKRMVREQTSLVERANEALLEQLLPVLDNFELAVSSIGPEVDQKVTKGIELTFADFTSVLEKAGLERIEAKGTPFDPNEHEAVLQDDGDGEPVVAEVLRTGWKLKGRVLRPAMVKVTRNG